MYHVRVADRLHQLAASIVGPRGEPSEQRWGWHAQEGRDRRQLVLTDHPHLHARAIRETDVPEDQHRRKNSDHVQKGYTQHTCSQFFFFFIRKKNYGKLIQNLDLDLDFFFFGNYHEKGFLRTQASFPRLKPDRVLSLVLPGIPVLQIPKVLQVVTLQVKFDCRVR